MKRERKKMEVSTTFSAKNETTKTIQTFLSLLG